MESTLNLQENDLEMFLHNSGNYFFSHHEENIDTMLPFVYEQTPEKPQK